MFDHLFQARNFVATIAALPLWGELAVGFSAVVIGVLIGRVYWRQFRAHAVMIELETRRVQSEFDLVSRDITKVKQEVTAQLSSRKLNL